MGLEKTQVSLISSFGALPSQVPPDKLLGKILTPIARYA
jgi:hypothetical protein